MPLLLWFILGAIIDKSLVNINALFYPLFFIFAIITTVFSTGANISAHRFQKSEISRNNEIHTAALIGIFASIVLSVLILIFMPEFLDFMHDDTTIIREFMVYATLQFLLYYISFFVLQKLWFVGENKRANRYTIAFNILIFVGILAAFFAKNLFGISSVWFVILGGILPLFIFTIWLFAKNFDWPTKWIFRPWNWLKFDAVDVTQNIFFFVIYLFGLANSFVFGPEWIVLISFETLVTDAQWEAGGAVNSAAQIDAAHDEFDYAIHRRNAMIFSVILSISVIIMFAIFLPFYRANFWLAGILIAANIFCFFLNNIYSIQTSYIQVHYGAGELVANKTFANILRTVCSFLPTPFCTTIGMVVSAIYQYITIGMIYKNKTHRHHKK